MSTRIVSPPRDLSSKERAVIEFLLSEPFPGHAELREQLDRVKVCEEYGCGDPTIVLCFQPPLPPRASVRRRVPVEAEALDQAGAKTHVLLHVVEGLVAELEVFSHEPGELSLPEPQQLTLFCLDTNRGFPPDR